MPLHVVHPEDTVIECCALLHTVSASLVRPLPCQSTFQGAAVRDAGAPRALWTELRSQAGSDALLVDVVWEDKTATRLPEALWWQWVPGLSAGERTAWPAHAARTACLGPHAVHLHVHQLCPCEPTL